MSDEDVYAALVSDTEEEKEVEDPHNSGMHVDDAQNLPNADGSVLINIRHPDTDKVQYSLIILSFYTLYIYIIWGGTVHCIMYISS